MIVMACDTDPALTQHVTPDSGNGVTCQHCGSVVIKDRFMGMTIKQRVASGALALALLSGTGASVAAQSQGGGTGQGQTGGAAGLVAAVLQIAADDAVNVQVVDSLNNLRALNNILNNSPILSGNDIDVTVGDVSLLSNFLNDVTLTDFLNDLDLVIGDVVGIAILSGGDIIVLT